MNEKYQATSSTVIKATAYVSALVLAVMDKHGAAYFDACMGDANLDLYEIREITPRLPDIK
jgi:hypothetical protein